MATNNRDRCVECKQLREPSIPRAMRMALDRAKRRLESATWEYDVALREVADWERRIAASTKRRRASRAKGG